MVDARAAAWAQGVVLLALGGFVGNFVLTLADHAQNGFFRPAEWVGVIASAYGVSALAAALFVRDDRPTLSMAVAVMIVQAAVGGLGFYYHLEANLRAPGRELQDKLIYGAPVFAPLLITDLAVLAGIALWALATNRSARSTRSIPAAGPGTAEPARVPLVPERAVRKYVIATAHCAEPMSKRS